jgi:hypothetical protein
LTDRSWNKAVRAVVIAGLLLVLTVFAVSNFVLVDVQLLGISARLRLAWVAVLPALAAFALGVVYGRLRFSAPVGADSDTRNGAAAGSPATRQ